MFFDDGKASLQQRGTIFDMLLVVWGSANERLEPLCCDLVDDSRRNKQWLTIVQALVQLPYSRLKKSFGECRSRTRSGQDIQDAH